MAGDQFLNHCQVRWLGTMDYLSCWQDMQHFTQNRDNHSLDEFWLLEHLPVFTQGQNGKTEHILDPGPIPVVKTDRGGQVTYHGPGQLMVYTLIDLQRKALNVRELVSALEQSVIDLLAEYSVVAYAKQKAPGIYTNHEEIEKKIGSIGLRIRRGCSYHGLAFNVSMDLAPFTRINPCGFSGMRMTHFYALGGLDQTQQTGHQLVNYLMKNLRYTSATWVDDQYSEKIDGYQNDQ